MRLARLIANVAPDTARGLMVPNPPPVLPFSPLQPIEQVESIEVDLYLKYVERLQGAGEKREPLYNIRKGFYETSRLAALIKPNFFDLKKFKPYLNEEIFLNLFSIILGCDTAHDFASTLSSKSFYRKINTLKKNKRVKNTKDGYGWIYTPSIVTENLKAIQGYMIKANVKGVMDACKFTRGKTATVSNDPNYTLLAHCIFIIHMEIFLKCNDKILLVISPSNIDVSVEKFCKDSLEVFFDCDDNAKLVSEAIVAILGLHKYPVSAILEPGTIKSTPNIYRALVPVEQYIPPIQVRIDAISGSYTVAPDAVALDMDRDAQVLIPDIASAFDPAWYSVLYTYYKNAGRVVPITLRATNIKAFVRVMNTPIYVVDTTLTPAGPPPRKEKPHVIATIKKFFLTGEFIKVVQPGENSKGSVMDSIVDEWMTAYKQMGTDLEPQYESSFLQFISQNTAVKTLGDLLQILTYAHETEPKVLHTFDEIASHIGAILGKTLIFDSKPSKYKPSELRYVYIDYVTAIDRNLDVLTWRLGCTICGEAIGRSTDFVWKFLGFNFGKINNITKKLKFMSNSELKNKLKSVGIKITKTIRGKRKYLSRKELENKAILFNKLQNTSKRMKIKIMYKKNGIYKYKTYKRLQKEIKKMKMKMKMKNKMKMKMKNKMKNKNKPKNKKNKPVVKRSSFG